MLFTCFTLFSISLSYCSLRVILLDKPIIAKWMMLKDLLWVYGKLETESGLESRTFDFSSKSRSRLLTICHGLTYSLTTSTLKDIVSILLIQTRLPGRLISLCQGTKVTQKYDSVSSMSHAGSPSYHSPTTPYALSSSIQLSMS